MRSCQGTAIQDAGGKGHESRAPGGGAEPAGVSGGRRRLRRAALVPPRPGPRLPFCLARTALPQKPAFPEYTRRGQSAARLGLEYDAAYLLGDLDRPLDFVVPTLTLQGDVNADRLASRRRLLHALDRATKDA